MQLHAGRIRACDDNHLDFGLYSADYTQTAFPIKLKYSYLWPISIFVKVCLQLNLLVNSQNEVYSYTIIQQLRLNLH